MLPVDLTDGAGVVAVTRDVEALFWVDPPTSGPDPVADARMGLNAARAVTTTTPTTLGSWAFDVLGPLL